MISELESISIDEWKKKTFFQKIKIVCLDDREFFKTAVQTILVSVLVIIAIVTLVGAIVGISFWITGGHKL